MTYRWIVFALDTPDDVRQAWISAHPEVNGWFDGIPPRLAAVAEAEGWTLPRMYEETVPVSDG